MRRVVMTGLGIVSALGRGRGALIEALSKGRSGVAPVTLFDTAHCRCGVAAEVQTGGVRIEDRSSHFLALALDDALADAGLEGDRPRPRVFQGTAHGPLDLWEQGDGCAGQPARMGREAWQGMGEGISVTTVTNACVASTWAVGLAYGCIRRGEADLAIACGAEALTHFLFRGFDALRALSPTRCRPFDRGRDGLVLGEGAAVLVLEAEETARRRGASIRAEVAGFGAAADAHHLTAPDVGGKGTAAALRAALAEARLQGVPDYINLHGTGTVHNDRMEVNALKRVFGDELGAIPLSGTKGATGHTSGAAGAVELAICLIALELGLLPMTVGLEEPDPVCAGLDLIRGEPRPGPCDTVVSLNSAFGGNNAALVLRRYR